MRNFWQVWWWLILGIINTLSVIMFLVDGEVVYAIAWGLLGVVCYSIFAVKLNKGGQNAEVR